MLANLLFWYKMLQSLLCSDACDLTVDPNTANTLRKVTYVGEKQTYPDHPERFDECLQVLCRESLTGRCYWETEWNSSHIFISMADKRIKMKRTGDCWFGHN